MTVHEANCIVKFSTWPASGTAVTNEGSAGSSYNATLSSNKYVALSSGFTAQKQTAVSDYITVPHGAGIDNVPNSVATWEIIFRWDTVSYAPYVIFFEKGTGTDSAFYGLGLYYYKAGNLLAIERDKTSSTDGAAWTCPFTPALGEWYDIQITWDMTGYSNTPVIKINNIGQTATSAGSTTAWINDSSYNLVICYLTHAVIQPVCYV